MDIGGGGVLNVGTVPGEELLVGGALKELVLRRALYAVWGRSRAEGGRGGGTHRCGLFASTYIAYYIYIYHMCMHVHDTERREREGEGRGGRGGEERGRQHNISHGTRDTHTHTHTHTHLLEEHTQGLIVLIATPSHVLRHLQFVGGRSCEGSVSVLFFFQKKNGHAQSTER